MKKIPSNEMEKIQGGSLQRICFGLGALTVFSASSLQLFTLYVAAPAIKYCWNN